MLRLLQRWWTKRYDTPQHEALAATAISLMLAALLTAVLGAASLFASVEHVSSIYLIPVMIAAIRGGVVPAVTVAVAGIGAAAFFFYPPIFNLRVQNTVQIIDLVLFVIVAVITGRLATNARRAKLREQTDALREALIGSVSHELRTPLASIVGSASVLAHSPKIAQDERLLPLATGLREEAERLNEHIQNLLDATRISSEGIRPHLEWIDPGDIVNTAVERKRRLLEGHPLQVIVAEDLPLIRMDAAMIEKALGQLIENAAKYSQMGSPIEIAAQPTGSSVEITVRDQGMGVTVDELAHIWERFYRGARQSEKIAGSGLGLWIAQALVAACGGEIRATSEGAGRGATFSLRLPVQDYVESARTGKYDE